LAQLPCQRGDHIRNIVERIEPRLRGDVRRHDHVAETGQGVVGATGRLVVQPFRGLGLGEQRRALGIALAAYRGQQLAIQEAAE